MKKKLVILALAFGLVGGLLATAGVAAAVNVPRGYLYLDTSGDGNFTVDWYDVGDTSPSATQTVVVSSKCEVSFTGPQLIVITPTGGTFGSGIGAVSHGLGVKTKNNCSTDQGKVNITQKLKISLGSAFRESVSITYAEVDVEGKRNAKLGVTYSPGTSIDPITLSNTSDNGPDSGTGDNNIVVLTPSSGARAIEFYPVAGGTNDPAVAIEGGGDGELGSTLRDSLGTNASVFELQETYDGILACEGVASAADGLLAGTFTRVETTNDGVADGCDEPAKPYNLSVAGAAITFEPFSPLITANYRGDLTFDKRSPADPQLVLQYDRDADGPDPTVNVQACNLRTAASSEVGIFPELGTANFPDLTTMSNDSDGKAPTWCLVAINTVTLGGGEVLDTFVLFGTGDPRFSGF